ncbi:hypothetical protein Drorol1_Dr00010760 [Drosera rotundifolia]
MSEPQTTAAAVAAAAATHPPLRRRVIVCGGGVIGVCTAYYLSKSGAAAVTLIEQSSIACAASGKAGGFLALDWCDGGPLSSLARSSFNLHRQLSDDLDGPISYGYRPLNALSLTIRDSDHGPSRSTGPGGFGPGPDVPGWVNGPVRDVKSIGSAQTTAQVDPFMFTGRVLRDGVEKYGVEVVKGRVVSVGTAREGHVGVVLEGGGVVEGDAIVLALGPWAGKLGVLGSVMRVYGMKAHSVVLRPKEVGKGGGGITPHALFLSYVEERGGKATDPEVYPRPNGEVYICGATAECEVPDDPEQVTPNPDSIKMIKKVAGKVSSHLAEGEAEVKVEQACILPYTDDGIPAIGELPGIKGCYVATGHSCWGILNAPATGAALAELILDGHSSIVDLSPFNPARFLKSKKR